MLRPQDTLRGKFRSICEWRQTLSCHMARLHPRPIGRKCDIYTPWSMISKQEPLYLSSVRVDGNTINTIMKNTGPEGQAMFTIKNDTSIHVTASKSGYTTITKVMTTSHLGPDTVMISLPRAIVTPTLTATTGHRGNHPDNPRTRHEPRWNIPGRVHKLTGTEHAKLAGCQWDEFSTALFHGNNICPAWCQIGEVMQK